MENNIYRPFKKNNSTLLYIDNGSNHPPNIKRQLPLMIEKRLTELSCNEHEFNKCKGDYEKALSDSGYHHRLRYSPAPPKRRNRSRNITWFHPPYNAAVKTNIGKKFLELIDKHFPPHNKYSKIFNRNTLKLSYSCTPSMKNIITSHNKQLTSKRDTEEPLACNCRKYTCPLNGECRSSAVVYKATVLSSTDQAKTKEYIGMAETDFKLRFYNHEYSFKNRQQRTKTTLSQYVWKMKDEGEPFEIKWNLLAKCRPYQCGSRNCDLCTTEKYKILFNQSDSNLNKRNEIANNCKHRAKFKLKNIK